MARSHSALLLILLAILGFIAVLLEAREDEKVGVHFRNQSGVRIQIGWLDEGSGKTILLTNIGINQEYSVSSYEGHKFNFREEGLGETGKCTSEEGCRTGSIHVSSKSEQYFIITDKLDVIESKPPANDLGSFPSPQSVIDPAGLLAKCRSDAEAAIVESASDTSNALEEFERCLSLGLAPKFHQLNSQIRFEEKLRTTTSDRIENYTCIDSDIETSTDIEETEWTDPRSKVPHRVHVKLDRPAGKIHVLENFASVEECEAVEEQAAGRLRAAVTEDGQGGTTVTKQRKAKQAQIFPEWYNESDPVAHLGHRIYDYTNHVLGLNITYHGQEPLMSIQYSGRGSQDTEPDRYHPHCDGQCDGNTLRVGGRVATMVVYCTVPNRGGYTSFASGNVLVRPQLGSGIFFSYLDPLTNQTDMELTKHSGCPVFEGEKKIATQWVRLGVDDTVSYRRYNSLDILYSQDGD